MSEALFERIHDSCDCDRIEPATIEEFVEFGLMPKDYVHYIGLQQRLQATMLLDLYGSSLRDSTCSYIMEDDEKHRAFRELIDFCKDKRLISSDLWDDFLRWNFVLSREDAEYYHGWLQYPKESSEFRLAVERKLSTQWDEEKAYASDKFEIYFKCDVIPEGKTWEEIGRPVRISKYDLDSQAMVTLKNTEVRRLYEVMKKEMDNIEKEEDTHLLQMPKGHDSAAISAGLPWIKKMYALSNRREIMENICDCMGDAVGTPDVYKFRDNDTLFVFCGEDKCQENGHWLKDVRVEFSFYGKPNKEYVIKRCIHCMQFRMSLQELLALFDSYGVPRGVIVYDDEEGSFSDFAETSVFYNMGYTVSRAVGLSAARRQQILKYAIDTGRASKYQVLNFLKQRMNINGMKPGNELAFRKWKEDYEFILGL